MSEESINIQHAMGSYIAQADSGATATVNIYQSIPPRLVDPTTLATAQQKIASLPLAIIPDIGLLPLSARVPFFVRNPLFVGRKAALQALASALKGNESGAMGYVQVAAVAGIGGIGKTDLAKEFVHRYGQYFMGGVFWLSFADPNAIPAEVAACSTALMQELPLDFRTIPLENQVRLVLSTWQGPMPRLLVFDSCEDEGLLARWRPSTGGCRVLVTSRRAKWALELGVTVLRLDVLSREESIELLRKHRPDLSANELDAIAVELGDLPLALHLAGKYLQEYKGSRLGEPAAYLAFLRQMTQSLRHPSLSEEERTYTTDHVQDIERTFAFSYERLNLSDAIDAAALKVLARAAYFAPSEPIPRELLRATMGAPDDDPLEAVVVKALQRLDALGLLDEQQGESYRMHRLLTMLVRERSASTDSEAQVDVEQALLERAEQLNDVGYPAPLLALQPHLREVTNAALQSESELAARLCNELGRHLMNVGAYSEAQFYLQQALAIRQHVLEPEHPDVATSFNNLAALYQDQGKYEQAKPLYKQALTIWQHVLGPKHPDTARSLNNLAELYHVEGEYEQAEPLYQRALAIREQVLGPEHPDTAQSLNNLAALYYAQGKYEQAKPLLQRALAIREQVLGPEHPDTAQSLNILASLYYAQGKYEQAEPLLQRALAIHEQVLGPQHPDTAQSLANLAEFYRTQGEYEQAEPLLQRALAIRVQVLGPEHPDTAQSLNILASLYYAQGKYEQAEPLYQRALAIREQVLGPEHPDTAQSLNNLATLYDIQGKYEQSEPLYQRALAIYERMLGPQHPNTAQSLNNLAALYYIQGKYEQAEPLYQRALTIRERVLGSDHSDTAVSLNILGGLYRIQGKYEQARPLLQRALTIRERVLGSDHSDTAASLNNLAAINYAQGKYEQAKSLLQRALVIYERVLDTQLFDGLQGHKGLYEKSFELDSSYYDKVISLNDVGLLLQERGDTATARSLFELLLKTLEPPTGSLHPPITQQQLAVQEVLDWLQAIFQDMDIAQMSRSRLARTTALNRAISELSSAPEKLDYFPHLEQLLIKRITDRWREVVAREAGRAGKIEILKEVASPYIFSVPVHTLVGRDDLFRDITTLWSVPGQRNSLLIYGHRRMGKTSLAQALASHRKFGDDTSLVYLDISGIKIKREGDLYYEIAVRLWLLVEDKIGEPNRKHFTPMNASTSFEIFLTRFHKISEKLRVILVLDEFEILHKYLGVEATGQVIENLRSQIQKYDWLTLALVGLNDLDDLGRSYRNPLLGWEPIHVSFLDVNQVAIVLTSPKGDPDFPLDYTLEALTMIATLTNGQPYLVQVIGHLLVQHYNYIVFTKQKEHSGVFDTADVQTVIGDVKFYDRAAAYFKGVWGQVTSGQSGEIVLLKALAEHEDGMDESALRVGTNLDETDFIQSLTALERHDILCRKDNHIYYTVPLMRRWVQDNCLQEIPVNPKKRTGGAQ